ncbi:hypothetical protein LguiA_009283 [Lonicera macranthoides]
MYTSSQISLQIQMLIIFQIFLISDVNILCTSKSMYKELLISSLYFNVCFLLLFTKLIK